MILVLERYKTEEMTYGVTQGRWQFSNR